MKGSKPVPVVVFLMAMSFCTLNGYMQSRYLLHYYSYSNQWFYDPRLLIGIIMFLVGMAINIHSDAVLRNLRKPNETGYKIPKGYKENIPAYYVNCLYIGGFFELVSCANYFGEALEWWGFGVACWSPPAFTFGLFTTCVLGTRALSHHK